MQAYDGPETRAETQQYGTKRTSKQANRTHLSSSSESAAGLLVLNSRNPLGFALEAAAAVALSSFSASLSLSDSSIATVCLLSVCCCCCCCVGFFFPLSSAASSVCISSPESWSSLSSIVS